MADVEAARIVRDLSGFSGDGYTKGRNLAWQITWYTLSHLVFQKWWLPARLRPGILRLFGADIGRDVLIRARVRIHWPWKLSVGANCWIGAGANLLNLEPIEIEPNVCISQEVFLCTGSHDRRSPTLEFANEPISIAHGSWVCARAFIRPGTEMAPNSFVGPGVVHP